MKKINENEVDIENLKITSKNEDNKKKEKSKSLEKKNTSNSIFDTNSIDSFIGKSYTHIAEDVSFI